MESSLEHLRSPRLGVDKECTQKDLNTSANAPSRFSLMVVEVDKRIVDFVDARSTDSGPFGQGSSSRGGEVYAGSSLIDAPCSDECGTRAWIAKNVVSHSSHAPPR